jgi:hypothetical protein
MTPTRLFFIAVLILSLTGGCSLARVPSPKSSEKAITRHFKKYGKKYPETDFGKFRTEKVEVESIDETQKGIASVQSFVYLQDGTVYRVRVTLHRKALGWRTHSWENLGRR